jgi:hypothetical protein
VTPEELATHQTGPALSFLGALFIATSAFIFILIGRWMLLQVLAKVRLRAEAVVEWQDDRDDIRANMAAGRWPEEPPDVVDAHLDDQPDEILTHEADVDLSVDNEAFADDFLAWESELGERAQ